MWTEVFRDKNLLDSVLATALDVSADSYKDIHKHVVHNSVHSGTMLTARYASPIVFYEEDVVLNLDSSGSLTQQVIPVTTNIVNCSFIADGPTLDSSSSVVSPGCFRLLSDAQDTAGICNKYSSMNHLRLFSKFVVIEDDIFSAYTTRQAGYSTTADLARLITLPKKAKYDAVLLSIASGQLSSTLISINSELLPSSISISLTKDMLDLTAALPVILLPIRNRLSREALVTISIGNNSYFSDCRNVSTQVTTYTCYGLDCLDDTLDMYSRVGFIHFSSPVASTKFNTDLAYSKQRIYVDGFTSDNIRRLVNCSIGAPLLDFGYDNGESLLNINLKDNVVVSNLTVYNIPLKLKVSKRAILASSQVNQEPSANFVVLEDVSYSRSMTGSIAGIAANQTAKLTLTIPNYVGEYAVEYIGNCFVLLKQITGPILQTPVSSISSIKILTSTGGSVTIATECTLSRSSDTKILMEQKEPLTDSVKILFGVDPTYISRLKTVYIPESVYNTSSNRRLISDTEFKAVVGEMPLHRIGDYKFYIREDIGSKFKSSAYYIYIDFYHSNSFIVSTNEIERLSGFTYASISNTLEYVKPVWALPMYTHSLPFVDFVDFISSILDINKLKIVMPISDTKKLNMADSMPINSAVRVKYIVLKLAGPLNATVGSNADLTVSDLSVRSCKIVSNTGTSVHISVIDDYEYTPILVPTLLSSIDIIDFYIPGVIGHMDIPDLGVTPVVGSSSPYTVSTDIFTGVSGDPDSITIASRGPTVKVK